MPAAELNMRKKEMVQELNGFIGLKKAYSSQAAARSELLAGGRAPGERDVDSESGAAHQLPNTSQLCRCCCCRCCMLATSPFPASLLPDRS